MRDAQWLELIAVAGVGVLTVAVSYLTVRATRARDRAEEEVSLTQTALGLVEPLRREIEELRFRVAVLEKDLAAERRYSRDLESTLRAHGIEPPKRRVGE